MTQKPPYLIAAALSCGAFVLYALTLAPTTQFWDASEYITAAHSLGIPHPPGNPFFVIVAHVWGLLPLAADYARRINLLAAVTSAVSTGLWFLIGERWLRPIVADTTWRRLAAGAGAIVGATMFTVWNQSVANEKVYTLSVVSIALVLWLTIRWADQAADPGSRRDNYLIVIVYLLALSATNHLMGLLVAPAVIVYVLMTDPGVLLRPRFWIAAVLVAVVGLSVNVYIPIRAHLDPYLNQGDAWTWPALRAVLTREQFGKPPLFDNPMYPPGADNPGRSVVLIGQQLLNYWEYFTWQFGRDWPGAVQRVVTVVFVALGLMGAYRHWRADRRSALAMTALLGTVTVALVFYMNFKWGFSQPYNTPRLEHEVRERDYFYIASFALWGVWVGMGIAALAEALTTALATRIPDPAKRWRLATPLLLIALIPLVGNHLSASRAGETVARDYARDVLHSVDPYALIITSGDNDTFPLWHAQEVEGIRRDVSVLVLSLANTNWYLEQLQRRPPVPFDTAQAGPLLRGKSWPRPSTPWMSRGYSTPTDTLPPYILLNQPVQGTVGPIQVVLDPRAIGRPYLERAELAVLQIIKDQVGKRPIYFATSTGNIADQLGLTPYLVGEGLVRRLTPKIVTPSDSIVQVEGRGFIDVPRARTLAFDVYLGGQAAARPRPRGWVDAASENSLYGYVFVYDTIASALRQRDPALATRATLLRDAILANTSFGAPRPRIRGGD